MLHNYYYNNAYIIELTGIIFSQVLKLYAWEPSLQKQVVCICDKEIKVLRDTVYLNDGTSFVRACAPFLVSLSIFSSFFIDNLRLSKSV